MKISSLIATVLFASATMTGAVYADDKDAAPKATETQADKAAVKPHSHVQEKTGMQQKMPEGQADKQKKNDKSKHLHPRDGK